jgi:Tfp pilus assembly protein PilN
VITQQVNLFQPIFRKERKLLSFRVLLQASGTVVLALLLMYGWGVRQTQVMRADLAQLQGQMSQHTRQLAALGTQVAQATKDGGQQQELARLEQELLARQKVVEALTRVRDSYTKGVSAYLESFARQAPSGMWLTGFTVRGGGEGLVIRGSALKPELVPAFVQRLSSEAALAGTHFGLLQMQREDGRQRQVDFTLYTGSELPEAAP